MSLPLSTNVGKIMPVPVTQFAPSLPVIQIKESPPSRHKKSPGSVHKKWFVALNVRGCVVKWWGQAVTASGGAFAGARAVVLKRVCRLSCASHGRPRPRVTLRQRGKDVECSSGEIRTIEFLSECRCLIWFKNSRLGLLYEKVQGEPDPI